MRKTLQGNQDLFHYPQKTDWLANSESDGDLTSFYQNNKEMVASIFQKYPAIEASHSNNALPMPDGFINSADEIYNELKIEVTAPHVSRN